MRVTPLLDTEGVPIGASAIVRDVSERSKRDAELRQSWDFLERSQEVGHIGSFKAEIGPESILLLTPEGYRLDFHVELE